MAGDRNLRIRMLLEAADRFTKPMKALLTGSRKAASAIAETKRELKALERTQSDLSGFRTLKSGLAGTEKELGEARAKVAALARDIRATSEPTKKLTSDFARAKREASDLKDRHERETAELQRLRNRLSEAGVATNRLASGERELRERVVATNRELAQQERRLERSHRLSGARRAYDAGQEATNRNFQSGVAKVTAGVGALLPVAGIAKEAIDFESVMADVKKVVNFSAGNNIQKLSNQVLQLSTRLPIAAEGIGQIVAAAGRSGIGDRELLGFAEDAAKMAIAFDMSADEAGTMMATWRTAFGMGREGVRHLGDQVNALTNKFGGNVNVVNEIVTSVGPLGKVAGAASGEIAGMAQMMAKLGIESEVGATGIKNTLITLARGSSTVPKAAKAFQELGLDATTVAKRMQKDAGGTILDVFTRISKLGKDEQVGVLTRLFGRESILAIAPLLTNLKQLQTNFRMVGDNAQVAGSMEREYASRAATTANAVQLANNNFQVLKITVGTQLLPTIVALAQRTGKLLQGVTAFARAHPTLTKGLLISTAAFGGLAITMGAFGIAAAGILAPFRALGVLAELLGTTKAAMLMRFGKVLLMPLGVFPRLWAGLRLFGKGLSLAGSAAVSSWPLIVRASVAIGQAAWGLSTTVARAGMLLLTNPMVLAIAALALALGGLAYLVYRNWDTITRKFHEGLSALAGLGAQFRAIGSHLVTGLVNGLLAKLGLIKDTIFSIGSKVVGWFKTKLGIHSPSRVFHGLGGFLMAGLENGIADNEGGPIQRMDRLSRKIGAALAVGAAAPAMAASGGGATARAAIVHATPAARASITINVYGAPGQKAEDLARAVAAELDRRERKAAAQARSGYADTPDWRNH